MLDLLVAAGRDPVTDRALRAELRALASPWALLSPSGFRRRSRTRPDELRRLAVPALVIWGADEPLGGAAVARAATDLIPRGRLEVVPGGHAPWLGHPALIAQLTADFAG
jgi:pimeloyl-ACP methyl ester carboxylesterase